MTGRTAPSPAPQPSAGDLDLVAILRALGDPVRLDIVTVLDANGEQTCGQLAERLRLPLSTLSRHLRQLRESGATHSRRDGTTRWVSLREQDLAARFPGLLPAITTAGRAPTRRSPPAR